MVGGGIHREVFVLHGAAQQHTKGSKFYSVSPISRLSTQTARNYEHLPIKIYGLYEISEIETRKILAECKLMI